MGNLWNKQATVAVPAVEASERAPVTPHPKAQLCLSQTVPLEPQCRLNLKVVILRACAVNVERIYLDDVADPAMRQPGFAVIRRRCSDVQVWVLPHACASQISDYVAQIVHRAHGIMIMCDETQDIREIVDVWQYHAVGAPRHAIVVSTKLKVQRVAHAFDQLFRLLEGLARPCSSGTGP
jgi:hypothetical protein